MGELTIDELAEATGIPRRRIRFYQTREVLPPPQRRGRIAYYDESHVERLRVIGELQDRGLRLAAIRDLVNDNEPTDPTVREWLGLDDHLARPWTEDTPQMITDDELSEQLATHAPGTKAALARTGLIEDRSEGLHRSWVVPSPALLGIALELDRAGVDVDTSARAGDVLSESLSRAAEKLVALFYERLGTSTSPETAVEALEALRPASDRAVRVVFAREIERALRARLQEGDRRPTSRREPRARRQPSRRRR